MYYQEGINDGEPTKYVIVGKNLVEDTEDYRKLKTLTSCVVVGGTVYMPSRACNNVNKPELL